MLEYLYRNRLIITYKGKRYMLTNPFNRNYQTPDNRSIRPVLEIAHVLADDLLNRAFILDGIVNATEGCEREIIAEHIDELRAMTETLAMIVVGIRLQHLCCHVVSPFF
jgi:hypothetical protein